MKIEKGCPICDSDVNGDKVNKFYCEDCNVLYSWNDVKSDYTLTVKKGKIAKIGVGRAKGFLYFVDKEGDVSRVRMARSRADKGTKKHEKIQKVSIKKEKGYLYYIDKDGDISRSPMKRGNNGN